jgi:nucleoid-associated protein YgaU
MLRNGMFLLCVVVALGCVSTDVHQRDQARARAEIVRLQADVQRLREHVEGQGVVHEDLNGRIDTLSRDAEADRARLEKRLAALERAVADLEKARATDRQAIIDTLSKNMAQALQRRPATTRRTLSGLEHTVQRGETLSEIAAAYNVRAGLIIEANGISDPDDIREGQKLIIPE